MTLVTLTVLSGLHDAPTFSGINGDLAELVEASDRILAGQFPYREFVPSYGPALYAWNACWYRLGGANWHAVMVQHFVVNAGLATLLTAIVAALALRTSRARLGFILASWVLALPGAGTLRVWIPLTSVALGLSDGASGYPLACLAAGLALLVSPDTGLAALVACVVLVIQPVGRRSFRWRPGAAWLMSAAVPLGLLGLWQPLACARYLRAAVGFAATYTWYLGLPFPDPTMPLGMLFLCPLVITALAGSVSVVRSLRPGLPSRREAALKDLALAVASVVFLRSLFGRSDYGHLVFVLAPSLLIAVRFAERRPPWGLMVAAGLVPFLIPTWTHDLIGFSPGRYDPRPDPRATVIPGEGLRASPEVAGKLARIVESVRSLTPPGEPVLALPCGGFGHFARRPPVLPVLLPDHLRVLPELSAWALDSLETRHVRLVMLGTGLFTPEDRDVYRQDDLAGARLAWATEADEMVTRDLREYLRRNFAYDRTVEGVRFYLRRARPLPARRDAVVARHEATSAELESLGRGAQVDLPLGGLACDEVRIDLRCDYPPGLASFAKDRLSIQCTSRAGRQVVTSLPLPPPRLAIDLRYRPGVSPLTRLGLRIDNPGWFNPRPTRVSRATVALVRYEADPSRGP